MDGVISPVPVPDPPANYRVSRVDVVKEASKRVPFNSLGLPEGYHRSDLLHTNLVIRVVPQDSLLQLDNYTNLSDGVLTDDGPLLVLNEKAIRAAYVPLDYREGFPTDPQSGIPFWHHLEFEPVDAFYAFEQYLNQGTSEGTRRLFALACTPRIQELALGKQATQRHQQLSPPHLSEATQNTHTHSHSHPTQNTQNTHSTTQEDLEREEFEFNRDLSIQTNHKLQEWFTLYYWSSRSRAHDLFYLDSI